MENVGRDHHEDHNLTPLELASDNHRDHRETSASASDKRELSGESSAADGKYVYWHAMQKLQAAYLKANDFTSIIPVLMVSDYSYVPTNEKFNFFQDLVPKIPGNV